MAVRGVSCVLISLITYYAPLYVSQIFAACCQLSAGRDL